MRSSRVVERETATRSRILQVFNRLCPNIIGNPYVLHWPFPTQALFLGLHNQKAAKKRLGTFEALYGGAAGGGKSDALLMAASQYLHHPNFSAIMFRRTYTDLSQPGALLDRAFEWWMGRKLGVRWDGTNKIFSFPSGAKVAMAYLASPRDHLRYQSAQYHLCAWDELTQWERDIQYRYVGLSRVRRLKSDRDIPLRTLSASNPGGPGHDWVAERFVGHTDPVTGENIPGAYPFVPATLRDNIHLDREDYEASLSELHPTVRDQLLKGDWSARDPGDYFRREWFGTLLDPEDVWEDENCIRIRWWDLAASEAEDACFTAGVKMAKHRRGVRAIEHVESFKATPGRRDDRILQVAQADGYGVHIGIEIEPGSGGPAQFEALKKKLNAAGFLVHGARPKLLQSDKKQDYIRQSSPTMKGKMGRADPVASCLERGWTRRGENPDSSVSPQWGVDLGLPPREQRDGILLYAGPWVHNFLSVIEGFPVTERADEVDALSGAWAWLETQSFGATAPLNPRKPAGRPLEELHPEERSELPNPSKDRFGRWKD